MGRLPRVRARRQADCVCLAAWGIVELTRIRSSNPDLEGSYLHRRWGKVKQPVSNADLSTAAATSAPADAAVYAVSAFGTSDGAVFAQHFTFTPKY